MIWCCPILLCLLQHCHCIWVPWEAFGHILKEWMSLASYCGSKRLRFGCAWTRFGTLAHFKRCLLLQYVLVLPNSSTHVATLYLGPMRSLWAYIEGMDGLHLLFTGADGSNLTAWSGLALRPSFKDVCSSSMSWCFPILLRMLQHCIWVPWGAFGHILKEWMAFISVSWGQTGLI